MIKDEVFRVILDVYAYRVNQRDHLMAVRSFAMAIASRLVEFDYTQTGLEDAMVALERREARLLPLDDCEAALAKYAPNAFENAKHCDECMVWRGHRLNCSK